MNPVLKVILLVLLLTFVLFAMCALCRAASHAFSVRRVGVGTAVVVGRKNDPLLPRRVLAAYEQNHFCHLEEGGPVLVLDCGLTKETKAACSAALGGDDRVIYLSPEKVCDYLLASTSEK